jgi:hypothetical protein
MIKGVSVALGIMVVSALIPIVHFVAVPASPFIGGYVGISYAQSASGTYAVKGLKFGSLLGLVVLIITAVAAAIVMAAIEPSQKVIVVMWVGIAVFTLYTGSMSTLGAMFASLKASKQPSDGAGPE